MPTEAEIAWAAGLFEGEGCFSITRASRRRRYDDVSIVVASTDRDVVEKFMAIVGCGNVYVQGSRKANWKPAWRWASNRQEDVLALIELFRPWLCARRLEKAEEAIELLSCGRVTSCLNCGKTLVRPRRGQLSCGRDPCRSIVHRLLRPELAEATG